MESSSSLCDAAIINKDAAINKKVDICPITYQRFTDPVVLSDGFTYERSAIAKWLKKHNTSPITRESVEQTLIPNRTLCQLLDIDQSSIPRTPTEEEEHTTEVESDTTDSDEEEREDESEDEDSINLTAQELRSYYTRRRSYNMVDDSEILRRYNYIGTRLLCLNEATPPIDRLRMIGETLRTNAETSAAHNSDENNRLGSPFPPAILERLGNILS